MERRITASAGVLSLCLGSVALGQETSTANTGQLEEVVVTGFRQSIEVSLDAKRDSVNFTDSISAEDVGKLPDNNLAEALQRVPGVQITRTNGEGQQISLRGLGPSFARVLLDGMPVSAASEGSVDQQARNREFDFDLLPSEIFSNLQVSKTPRASTVEGGLAGTVDLRTPRPFDYDDFQASYQLQAMYQSSSEEVDPRGSFLISKNWDGKFGALLNVSMSKRSFRTDGWSSQGWTSGRVPGNPVTPTELYQPGFDWNLPSVGASAANQRPDFVNESGLTNVQLAQAQLPRLGRPEVQVGDRDRVGGTLALQWAPTDKLVFNLDVIYAKLESDFDRYTNNLLVRNTNLGTAGATGFGYLTPSNFTVDSNNTLTHGTLLGAKFWSENRLFEQESDFRHVGLGGSWQIADNLNLDVKASKAESDFRWRMTTYLFLSRPGAVDIDVPSDGIPIITPQLELTNVANWQFDTVRVQPRTREEDNENLALDLTWGDEERNIRVGALANKFYRERLAYSSSVGVTQGTALTPFGYTGGANLNQFNIAPFARVVPVNYGEHFDSPAGYNRWLVADLDAFEGMLNPNALDAAANLDFQNSGSYEEKNLSAYVEANGAFDLWGRTLRANLGLRYVQTEHEMVGFTRTSAPPPAAANLFGLRQEDYGRNTIEGDYSEMLPSLNLSYDISDSVLARFALSRALTRPNPGDLQPFTSVSTAGVVTQGNPNLDPYISDQLDGGLEWYFAEGAVLGGNLFYKEITGFVQRENIRLPFRNAGIPLDTITDPTIQALLPQGLDTELVFNTPVNRDSTTYLKGVELLYQQRLDSLLQGSGVTLNYTRLDSGSQVVLGLAKHNVNAVAYYETERFATRLSYNYRYDYVECERNCGSTSPETGFRLAAGYLDFNSSVNFTALSQDLTLSLEVLNLLNEEEYSFYGFENRANTLNKPGRQFILGIRGQF
jgi:iron complex outermembrane receptor protein